MIKSFISNLEIQHRLFPSSQCKSQAVLFYPRIEPNQLLSTIIRVDLGRMAMKGYSTFSRHQMV